MLLRKYGKRAIAGLVILAVAGVTHGFYLRGRGEAPEGLHYETKAADRGPIRVTVSATGVLQPKTTVDLKSNAGGEVVQLPVEVGDFVRAGQLIASIDPTDARVQLDQAEADQRAAEWRIDQAKHQVTYGARIDDEGVATAEAGVEAAREHLAQAQSNLEAIRVSVPATISRAEQDRNVATAALAQLQQATHPQAHASAEAAVREAEEAARTVRREAAREAQLVARGLSTRSALEAVRSQLATAEANLANARVRAQTLEAQLRAELDAAVGKEKQAAEALTEAEASRSQIAVREKDVAASQASLEQSLAQLEQQKRQRDWNRQNRPLDRAWQEEQQYRTAAAVQQARKTLEYTEVKAPRDGVILQKYVEQGAVIASGRGGFADAGTKIAQLGDVSEMQAFCLVDETDIAQVHKGQKVRITVDAYPGRYWQGIVDRVDPQAKLEQNVTTIPVTVTVLNPYGGGMLAARGRSSPAPVAGARGAFTGAGPALRPEMNANCEFEVVSTGPVVRVPNEAVKEGKSGTSVQVLVKGRPQIRVIRPGAVDADYTEVRSGVKERERVVVATIDPEAEKKAKALATQTNSPLGSPLSPFGQRRPGGGRGR